MASEVWIGIATIAVVIVVGVVLGVLMNNAAQKLDVVLAAKNKAKFEKQQGMESLPYWQKKQIEARVDLAEADEHLRRLLKNQQEEEEKLEQKSPQLKRKENP